MKTFPVLICDNSYWTSVIFNCRRLVQNRQRLCTSTVHATITFTVAAIVTSVRRAYMRVIIKEGKKQLPYILLGQFHVIVRQCLMFPKIHYDIVSLRLAITACTPCLLQMADQIS